MAYYNQNFYNRNFTFQYIPPPPMPPRFFISPTPQITDQDFVKQFERYKNKVTIKTPSIAQVRDRMRILVQNLNYLKMNEKILVEKLETLTDEEWYSTVAEMKENRSKIDDALSFLNDSCVESMRRALAKRSAKRLRLKRRNLEKKAETEDLLKARKEQSLRIDEKLQNIKEDMDKVKMEEEAKLEADNILRDVLRKKHDAKKYIVKLEALIKLRHARQNTAKGRGQAVSETDAVEFNGNIEKLISLWKRKLGQYEAEERELQEKLSQSQKPAGNKTEDDIVRTLQEWQTMLFGDAPQFDFKGDVNGFLVVRAKWDKYSSNEGTSLPIGWVLPS